MDDVFVKKSVAFCSQETKSKWKRYQKTNLAISYCTSWSKRNLARCARWSKHLSLRWKNSKIRNQLFQFLRNDFSSAVFLWWFYRDDEVEFSQQSDSMPGKVAQEMRLFLKRQKTELSVLSNRLMFHSQSVKSSKAVRLIVGDPVLLHHSCKARPAV